MLNIIIDAVSAKIKAELGESFTIYKEPQEQGFLTPCFFIGLKASAQKKMIGKRYFLERQFDIEYHPGSVNKNAEIHDMIDRLNHILEYVEPEGEVLRGTKMNCEIKDNILHFYVNYNSYVYKQTEAEEVMESAEVNYRLKDDSLG